MLNAKIELLEAELAELRALFLTKRKRKVGLQHVPVPLPLPRPFSEFRSRARKTAGGGGGQRQRQKPKPVHRLPPRRSQSRDSRPAILRRRQRSSARCRSCLQNTTKPGQPIKDGYHWHVLPGSFAAIRLGPAGVVYSVTIESS